MAWPNKLFFLDDEKLCILRITQKYKDNVALKVVEVMVYEWPDSFQSKKVRGENGPGCWAMRPVEGHPDRCLFQWLLDTDIKVWHFLPFSRILTLDFISGLDTSVHHRQSPVRHPIRVHRQHSRARSRLTRWPDAWLHSCLLQWYGRRGSTYALKDQTTPLSPNWPKSWILVSQPPKLLRCALSIKASSSESVSQQLWVATLLNKFI